MAISGAKPAKGVSCQAPLGGISAQLGVKSFPLLLRTGEIERFEEHRDIGIFAFFDALLKNTAKVTHCRDVVALGLVGAGMSDAEADRTIDALPPHASMALRAVARELIWAAFAVPEDKKKDVEAGSLPKARGRKSTTPKPTSKTQ